MAPIFGCEAVFRERILQAVTTPVTKAAFSLIEKEETERIIKGARKFVQNECAVITFQKNAWENLRFENDPKYTIDRAKNGMLSGHLKGNSKIQLFGVPPTRLVGPCRKTLKRIKNTCDANPE
jgi:hypothetical protein